MDIIPNLIELSKKDYFVILNFRRESPMRRQNKKKCSFRFMNAEEHVHMLNVDVRAKEANWY